MRPELVISLDDDMFPVSGACSVCHDPMPLEPPVSDSHEQIIHLSEQFKLQLEKKHPMASHGPTLEPLENEGL
jgi:hypothetical protein